MLIRGTGVRQPASQHPPLDMDSGLALQAPRNDDRRDTDRYDSSVEAALLEVMPPIRRTHVKASVSSWDTSENSYLLRLTRSDDHLLADARHDIARSRSFSPDTLIWRAREARC